MSGKTEEKAHSKGKVGVDFVYMQGPDSAPGANDGEVIEVSTSGMAISKKMFAGYRQVDSAKGDRGDK
jgi:hypothetical protein